MLNDIAWAFRMVKARRARRRALFSIRQRFDDALRPHVVGVYPDERSDVIAYPDAIYHADTHDFARAFSKLR